MAVQEKPAEPRIIAGVDPGSHRPGFAVFDLTKGRFVLARSLRLKADDAFDERLYQLYKAARSIFAEHEPDIVVVERMYLKKNVQTLSRLDQQVGALVIAARETGAEVRHELIRNARSVVERLRHLWDRLGLTQEQLDDPDVNDAVTLCFAETLRYDTVLSR